MDTKYSLTTLLNNLLKLQNNGYQIITKLSDVVASNADTVEIDVMDGNGYVINIKTDQLNRFGQGSYGVTIASINGAMILSDRPIIEIICTDENLYKFNIDIIR